jgi:hypothetical protein
MTATGSAAGPPARAPQAGRQVRGQAGGRVRDQEDRGQERRQVRGQKDED